MHSSPRNVGRMVPITEDVPETTEQRFREAIALRSADYAEAYPRAATFEAQLLVALYEAINGEAVNLRGIRSVEGFRGALRGEKNFHLADLCRLATSPVREARAAVKAVAQELAAAVGYTLEPMEATATEAHGALAGIATHAGEVMADVSMALANDGRMDEHEARAVEPKLDQLERSVARMRATVTAAKGSGR